MADLYVIVSLSALQLAAEAGNRDATRIYHQVISLDDGISLRIEGDPWIIPENLPSDSKDIELHVIGAHKWLCCSKQLYSLRKAGYRAGYLENLCYDEDGYRIREEELPRDFREVVPEYI